ncbi:hypothetical protein HT576_21435 [Haloterrigena sp. SYSU A121-1]|uniref:Uncharacterized protein n=1 Tax=Haloterrigena gelatinilytica TaxID=2741724 RepID=A0A8J8KGL8_9EURY|nr:hypothetical protein [Haloterrigena gelatinilytica]NUB93553.1 hypothetical protein [Haloterrigena gelatinilytica]
MSGRGTTPNRRRRALVAVCVLSLVGVLVTGTVAATIPIQKGVATPLQNESRNDVNGDESPGDPMAGESAPPADTSGNESPPRPSVGNDTSGSAPPLAVPATEPQITQVAEGNVTVAVAEHQSVRAGEPSPITLEVTNDGDRQAIDVVVTVRSTDGSVTFGPPDAPQPTRSVVVDDIWPGDTETATVDVVAAAVDSGTYPLFASVQYQIDTGGPADDEFRLNETDETNDTRIDDDDDEDIVVRTDGPTLLELSVEESRAFDVTPVRDEVPVDGAGVYEARITNDGDEPVTNVVVTIEVGPPLTSESPTAYVGALEPGESETVRFALESSADAVETTTSVALSIAYDAASGQRASADPVRVPVSVAETDEDTDVDSVAPFVAVAVAFALTAIWWFRRR